MRNKYWALKLTGIIVGVFILQLIFKETFNNNFALVSSEVLFKPWMIVTSIFLHGGLGHLLLNGFGLALFGSILENHIGSKRFLILFFTAGIFANLLSPFFYSSSLGASGAIFGVLGTLTYLKPRMTIWLNFLPMPLWLASIYWVFENIVGIFIPDNIANLAHLSGLAFGLGFGFYIKGKKPKVEIKKREDLMITKEELEDWENKYIKP